VTVEPSTQPSLLPQRLRATALWACLVAANAAFGQALPATGPIAWTNLSPAQRSLLTPLESDWRTISPAQQQKWAEVANRFPALPPEERGRLQQRLADWSRLTPQERAAARMNFQEARQLSPQERQQQWQSYNALPADQRRALAEKSDRARPVPADPRTSAPNTKSSVVRAAPPPPAQPVGATVVQRGSGATTNLVSKPTTPPLHQQAGLPKVAAMPGFVDSATLLPKRGAQGAAARAPEGDGDKQRNVQ
jgi:hypothetical protein